MDSKIKEKTNNEEARARDFDVESRINCCLEIASIDADLVKIHVNTETSKSHTLLSEEKRIAVAPSSVARRHLEHAYLEVAQSCSIAPLLLQYKHDGERGYGSFGVFSKKAIKSGTQISGLIGIVTYAPENVNYRNSFSGFLESNGEIRMFLGPLSFVNSSCVPNSKYVRQRSKPGIIKLQTIRPVESLEEITVYYGNGYFGTGNKHCKCPFVDKHQRSTKIVARLRSEQRRIMSETAEDSSDSEGEQMFIRSGIDEESAEIPEVCEMSEIADEVEISQRLVDQDFTDLPSCSFSERVCSLRQRSGVVLGVSSKRRGYLKCKVCSLWLPSEDIMRHTGTVHAKEAVLECPLCCHTFSFLWSLRRHYISHKERMHEECDRNHEGDVLEAEGNELEGMPEMDPSSDKSPSPMTVMSSDSLGDNLTFQMNAHLVARKEEIGETNFAFKMFHRDIRCPQKFCDVNITSENMSKHFSKFHLLEREINCPCCPRFFSNWKALRKHLLRMHSDETDDSVEQEPLPLAASNPAIDFDASCTSATIECPVSAWEQFLSQRNFGDSFFFDLLSSSSMTITQTFSVMSFMEQSYENIVSFIVETLSRLSHDCPQLLSNQVFEMAFSFLSQTSFTSLDTEKKLMNFLGTQERFVHPREILLGGDYETRYHNGLPQQMFVERKAEFISLADVLMKVILPSDEVISQCLKYHQLLSELSQSGILLDGQQLAMDRNPLANVDATLHVDATDFVLSIQLYFDEVEPANPIGTRAIIHKVGCFYWSFKSLLPWMNEDSRLTHVAVIAASLDFKTYGLDPILMEISRDIRSLEVCESFKTSSGREISVKGCKLTFVADNLAYHSVLGFTEKFSSGFCCEICLTEQKDFKFYRRETTSSLRNPDETAKIATDVVHGKIVMGIKRLCLLRTKNFDPYRNLTADLQHDILEGGLGYTIKLVLTKLVEGKVVSLFEINRRINSFGYGIDKTSKPSEIDEVKFKNEKDHSLKQKASQMFALYGFLPCMLSDKVPTNEKHWSFLLDYFNLLEYLFSATFVESDLLILRGLIEEHLVEFVRLFPSNPIIFKQHRLTHYPRILSRSGPLINLCVLKYERKHQWFKRLTHVTGNFKNVPKTYAVRHQIRQYASWRNGLPVKAKPEYSAGTSRDGESAIGPFLYVAELPLINVNNESDFVAKKVTIWGTVYSQHDVLILDINDSWPTLALIESVIAGEKEPVFACVLLDIVDYCYHSRSYLINYPSNSCHRMLKKHSDLHDYHPLSLHRCFDASCSWFHVILRQKLGYNNFACLI